MIVIIGLGTGGLYAARWISMHSRNEKITIIEKRSYETYSPCSIPMVVEGKISEKDIVHPFPKSKNTEVLTNHEAVEIDNVNKEVKVKNLGDGSERVIKYDSLIYSAGATPWLPPVEGVHLEGVFTVRTVEDAIRIKNWAEKSSKVLVVGAGAIGVEMAHALRKRGLEVTIVEMLNWAFPTAIDRDMAKYVDEYLRKEGIRTIYGAKVEKILGSQSVEGAIIAGEKEDFDMVIMSTGVRPNTGLLKDKVKLDDRGFVMVDERMHTSDPSIYAIGDCVRTPYGVIQLATTALNQAIVAAINATGGDAKIRKPNGAFVSAFGGYEVASVGKMEGVIGRGWSRVNPYSEEKVVMKIYVSEDGRINGAQAVGPGAGSRIDILSALIRTGGKVWDLAFMEKSYCPELCELYDVIKIAAENAMRKLKIEKYEI